MIHKLFNSVLLFFTFSIYSQNVGNFSYPDINNQYKSFDDLKGTKLTIIDFWASWCKPCTQSIPVLVDLYNKYKEQGVQFIGLSNDGPRSVSKVKPLVNSLKITYPVLIDINGELMGKLKFSFFPTLIICDTKGNILWVHEGFSKGDETIIATEIDKWLLQTGL